MMPARPWMRLPARPSRRVLMMGMPPATAASKPTATPARRAASKISLPWWAISALLAVTTCLPALMAASTSARAGSMPPISSATMSICGWWTSSNGSASRCTCPASGPRGRLASFTDACVTRSGRPARRAISSPLRASSSSVPPPTVPRPSRPMRTAFMRRPAPAGPRRRAACGGWSAPPGACGVRSRSGQSARTRPRIRQNRCPATPPRAPRSAGAC